GRHPRRHAPPGRRARHRRAGCRRRRRPRARPAQPRRISLARGPVGAVRAVGRPRFGPDDRRLERQRHRGREARAVARGAVGRLRVRAAPRRGIDELVEAVRIARGTIPEARLDLVLAATGDESKAYLDRLRSSLEAETWVTIGASPYPELGERLSRAWVLAIPTPGHPYWDSVAPVKLFDYFAAGRPVMTTPRAETARLVRDHDAGDR